MKPQFATVAVACALLAFLHTPSLKSQGVAARAAQFTAIPNWWQLPDGREWGSTDGMGIDTRGNIWVAERCGGTSCLGSPLPVIFEIDSSGRTLKTFGTGLFNSPHSIHIDRDDHLWVADRLAQQVYKFALDGTVLMTLGIKDVAADKPNTFNQPTDVTTAPNGDIFVADGHGGDSNARIVKFSSNGTFIKAWGHKGNKPGEFDTPHSLAMDSRGRLFVADRGNYRIQIFDQDGKFLDEWRQFSRPTGLYIDKNDILYVTDSGTTPLPNPGIRVGNARTGEVIAFIPDPEAGTGGAESLVADRAGNIYRPEENGRGLVKFAKE